MAFTSDPSTHRQCFNVNITDDLILEDTERFSLTLTLADSNVPVVVIPDVSEVEIIDDDGKDCSRMRRSRSFMLIPTGIVVGFETIFTSADEGNDTVELCVRIFTEAAMLPTHINMSFSLDLVSMSGTAGKHSCNEYHRLFLKH